MRKIVIKDINGNNPISGFELSPTKYEYVENDMDANKVTFKLMIPKQSDENGVEIPIPFNYNWYVDIQVRQPKFDGDTDIYDRYYLSRVIPPAKKNTSSALFEYNFEFEFIDRELRRYRMREIYSDLQGYVLDYNTNFSFVGDVKEFLLRLWENIKIKLVNPDTGVTDWNISYLQYVEDTVGNPILIDRYYGIEDENIIDTDTGKSQKPIDSLREGNGNIYTWPTVDINNATLWEVLKMFYDIFGVRWKLEYENGIKWIRFNELDITCPHLFEYGGGLDRKSSGGLIEINRSNKETDIRTLLTGLGGDRNLPANYFRLMDNEWLSDGNFAARPTYFTNIMPKSFRMYMFGWNDLYSKNPNKPDNYTEEDTPVNYANANVIFNLLANQPLTVDLYNQWRNIFYTGYNGDYQLNFTDFYSNLEVDLGLDVTQSMLNFDYDDIDFSTPPYDFKAYVAGFRNAMVNRTHNENNEVSDTFGYSPIDYVLSRMNKVYGIKEGVLEPNENIYPTINTWRNIIPKSIIQDLGNMPVDWNISKGVYTRVNEIVDSKINISGDTKGQNEGYIVYVNPAEQQNNTIIVEPIIEAGRVKSPFPKSTSYALTPFPTREGNRMLNKNLDELIFDFDVADIDGSMTVSIGVYRFNDSNGNPSTIAPTVNDFSSPNWSLDNIHGGHTYMWDYQAIGKSDDLSTILTECISGSSTPITFDVGSLEVNNVGGDTFNHELQFKHNFSASNAYYGIRYTITANTGIGSYSYTVRTNPRSRPEQKEGIRYDIFSRFSSVFNVKNPFIRTKPNETNFNLYIKDIGFDISENRFWGADEAVVQFISGLLAGEDYNFVINKKAIENSTLLDQATAPEIQCLCYFDKERTKPCIASIPAKYMIGLNRSESNLDIGEYLPNKTKYTVPCSSMIFQGENTGEVPPINGYIYDTDGVRHTYNIGDNFILLGIELPFEYVYMAENQLEIANRIELSKVDRESVDFAVEFDKIFSEEVLKNTLDENGNTLYDTIRAGNVLNIRNLSLVNVLDENNINLSTYPLHIKTLSKSYNENDNAR